MIQPKIMRVVTADAEPIQDVGRAVLLISGKTRFTRRVTRVMLSMGVDLIACDGTTSAARWLQQAPVKMVICHVSDNLSLASVIEVLSAHPTIPVVLFFDTDDRNNLATLFDQLSFGSVAAIAGSFEDADLLRASRKVFEGAIFGIEKHLNWGSAIHTYSLASTADKEPLLESLNSFLDKIQCSETAIRRILTVTDEFVMNSLYDAPVDANGRHFNADRPRDQSVSLPPTALLNVSFGSDGKKFVLSCSDSFGSLDVNKATRSLSRCLRGGKDQISQGTGGAGIGIYMAYEYLDHLIVNLEVGVKTEFVGVLDISSFPRAQFTGGKSFNLYVTSSPQEHIATAAKPK